MTSSAEQLGQIIGNLVQQQQVTSQNKNGQVVQTTKRRTIYEDPVLGAQVTLTKKVPLSNSLQFDHPVKGDWNVYVWDGGYDASQDEVLDIQNF